ncbi:DUF6461 domain-containing protein [Nonomuraea dietziae]|uniref:Uncharacterized protein n=1 Tax=Nonomuraea dietziae TaxID=65515 RepID=A0A7W5V8Y7_9ACTN|nr:hypothetical protein [Nonomuraea dietziae]MBB3727105.1 hypothetical protein [Nonomuraea dietziae]
MTPLVAVLPRHVPASGVRSITEGGRQALGLRMDVNDGRVAVSFESTWPEERFGDDPHALDHLMDGLRFQISDDDILDNRVDRARS